MATKLTVWELLALFWAQRHRRKQDDIGNTVASAVARSWRYMDFEKLDDTTPLWVDVAVPSVRYGFERSQMATAAFIRDYRTVAALSANPNANIDPLPRWTTARQFTRAAEPVPEGREAAPALDETRLSRLLAAAGPGRVKRSLPTFEANAMAIGQKGAAGAATTQAMEGGRGITRLEAVRDVRSATGWQRMTDGDPCAFCALLAANGPVYSKTSFDTSNSEKHLTRRAQKNVKFVPDVEADLLGEPDGIAKVHDHCRCTLVPVYSDFDLIDPVGQIAADLWSTSTTDRSGDEAFKFYQKLYRQIRKDVGPLVDFDVTQSELQAAIEDALAELDPAATGAGYLRSTVTRLKTA